MAFSKEGFFRIFQSELRPVLQRFFENRRTRVTIEMAADWTDSGTLNRLSALELVEIDVAAGEYRLDDRAERFLEEMLGASEVAQADWLVGLLEEIRRNIDGYQRLSDPHKGAGLLRRICRLLHACKTRSQRHLEEVKAAVDYDYRAGSDYEVKLLRLKWHLERTRSYGKAIDELSTLLRHDTFFQVHQELEIVSLRRQVLHSCSKVGDALIDIYQCIEDYLNRVQRDYARTRKLIRLCGLIDRHEHLTATNIADVAAKATGPWFHEFRIRTSLDPTIIDTRPELLLRVLAREGIGPAANKPRKISSDEGEADDIPAVIDWQDVYDTFSRQKDDLFVFLGKIRVEGRPLTEEERIDGYCAILTNEDWSGTWEDRPFEMATDGVWEYAVVQPPALSSK
ncbi:MAG TPA: hypothetical protein PLV05_01995 [Verrucomicrobiota bacterium]|jgi:hypothetical protein|nr:hypothetical protein [Verrucomicrobiota bacterium]HPC51852.1 hypothetical protein [Verrucomicrobiota bacterium]HPL35717.1 hypothetical protein [Verrucomicrobiota bacterium]HRV39077.1 hypothetical protein [Candidatus Paceibacterota bacterium]